MITVVGVILMNVMRRHPRALLMKILLVSLEPRRDRIPTG